MTFEQWWVENQSNVATTREIAELIWNAAQEAVLVPLLAGEDGD